MKKISSIFLLFLLLVLPIHVKANTYYITGTDLSISIDNSSWHVFTRDNIYQNSELTALELTYEYMNEYMKNNQVYLDAAEFVNDDDDENLEFFISIFTLEEKVGNLHTYSSKEINGLGKELINSGKFNTSSFEIYGNEYKYIELEYRDMGYNFYQFYTVINGRGYNFIAQKTNPITYEDKNEIKRIIDTINFNIDEDYEKSISSSSSNLTLNNAILGAIKGAIIAGGSVIIVKIINKKKRHQ